MPDTAIESAVRAGSANRHKHELVDFVLPNLDALDTAEIYELIVERHRTAPAIVTSTERSSSGSA